MAGGSDVMQAWGPSCTLPTTAAVEYRSRCDSQYHERPESLNRGVDRCGKYALYVRSASSTSRHPGVRGVGPRYETRSKGSNALLGRDGARRMSDMELHKKPLVLVAADDDMFQRSVCRVLQHAGLDTVTVTDGARTLDVAAEQHPDLILLDIDLAGCDGREVLGQLKRDARTTDIPVFMNSARDTHLERWVAFELGAADYFGKPFPVQVLAQRILSHLRPPAH